MRLVMYLMMMMMMIMPFQIPGWMMKVSFVFRVAFRVKVACPEVDTWNDQTTANDDLRQPTYPPTYVPTYVILVLLVRGNSTTRQIRY